MAQQSATRNNRRKGKKVSTFTPMSPEEALTSAIGYADDDFRTAIIEIVREHSPSIEICQAIWVYAVSLFNGDGSLPLGLDEEMVLKVQTAFAVVCEKRLVCRILPGQFYHWYDDAVYQLRSASRPTNQLAERREKAIA